MRKLLIFTGLLLLMLTMFFGCQTTTMEGGEEEAVTKQETALPEDNAVAGKEYTLAVLHTNDMHGHPVKFYNYPAPDVGGLPAIATLAQMTRESYDFTLMLDAGDLNTGRPESNFFKAEPDIIGYNHIGYDALALGNHEFDRSLADLKEQQALADFPFISANVMTQGGDYLVDPYIIKEFEGVKVGIFGMVTKETEIVGNPDIVGDLVFADEVETAKKMVSELKDKTDIIIALVHMGIYTDETKGSKRVAAAVDGIDLIIDGHTHSQLQEPVVINGTPIVQAWHWGLNVGKAVFKVQDRIVKSFTWEPVPINLKNRISNDDGSSTYEPIGEPLAEDEALAAKLQVYVDKVEGILSEVIGNASETFFNTDVRSKETALGDMVADSMKWYTKNMGVDFAIQNGGGIRADLPEGDIAKKVVYEVLPFDNSVMVVTLSGEKVQELFDYIATISQGKGAFPQVSEGLTYTVDYTQGICTDVLINGSPIDPNGMYKIATNSYMASGGDGYAMFKDAIEKYDTSAFQRDVFIEYIMAIGGDISPAVKNRINIIGSDAALLFVLEPAA